MPSCKVPQLVVVETLQILLLQQNVDALLDIGNLWYET